MSRKGGTGGGEWVYLRGANSIAISGLGSTCRNTGAIRHGSSKMVDKFGLDSAAVLSSYVKTIMIVVINTP